ncbi:MAG: hypothetical protein JRJ84_24860 [Deltaproteobacteria bacterium]|nr:hypothetical protein [Deltaproteobacteria bacterium]
MLWIPLAIGAFLGVLLMGAAVLGALGSRKRWRGYADADIQSLIAEIDRPPAFEPLEMEPFTMSWPSEIDRPKTALPERPWPSETWDDVYFGAQARGDLRKAAIAAQDAEVRRAQAVQRNAEAHRQSSKKHKAKKREPTERELREQQSRETLQQTRQQEGHQGPTPEQVAQMVKQYGLAGAVEHIRDETGWDFRTAAQYLANTLRDQR